jgi:hypothetical protein
MKRLGWLLIGHDDEENNTIINEWGIERADSMRLRDMSQRKSVVIVQKHKWNSTVFLKKENLSTQWKSPRGRPFRFACFCFLKKTTIVAQNNKINKLQSLKKVKIK